MSFTNGSALNFHFASVEPGSLGRLKLLSASDLPASIHQSHIRQRQLDLACIHDHFELKLIFDENSELVTYILNFLSISLTFMLKDKSELPSPTHKATSLKFGEIAPNNACTKHIVVRFHDSGES